MQYGPDDGVLPRRVLQDRPGRPGKPHHLRGRHHQVLDHQRGIGNDLTTPRPQYRFPGLVPGDRWCVTAVNWARAYHDGAAAPMVLSSTRGHIHMVPLEVLRQHAVDVPDDPSAL